MCFTRIIKSEYQKYPKGKKWADPEWTEFMRKVMDCVAEAMRCEVARLRPENKEESGEYLNIDAFFIDKSAYNDKKLVKPYGDPLVLPSAVVEFENSYDIEKISYCLWKTLCIRARIRVLICYQSSKDKVESLKNKLEDVVRNGRLMKEADGDLLVIIGNERVGEEAPLEEYFTAFEWQNDRLEKIENLKW